MSLVIVHSANGNQNQNQNQAVAGIFRVKGGKVIEHRHVIQPVPDESANDNTMF